MSRILLVRELKERVGFWKVVTIALQELRKEAMHSVAKMENVADLEDPLFSRRGYLAGPSGVDMMPPHYEEDAATW